jgi:hypothetical protein
MTLFEALVALCFAVWSAMTPSYAHVGDAAAIAGAIAQAVVDDGKRAPVFSSHAEDAALAAVYAAHESSLNAHAWHESDNDEDHPSVGPWQLGVEWQGRPLFAQARVWLYMLHEGRRICSESPAAPLSGGCKRARRLADRRHAEATSLLATALHGFSQTPCQLQPAPEMHAVQAPIGVQQMPWMAMP